MEVVGASAGPVIVVGMCGSLAEDQFGVVKCVVGEQNALSEQGEGVGGK